MRITAISGSRVDRGAGGNNGERPAAPVEQSRANDEQAIRLEGAAYAKAANAHDAKALAALFVPAGEIVNQEGHAVQGRQAIEETFAACFAANPSLQISVSTQSIRFVTPSVAIEDGDSRITTVQPPAPSTTATRSFT